MENGCTFLKKFYKNIKKIAHYSMERKRKKELATDKDML